MGWISDRLRQVAKIAVAKYVSRESNLLVAFPNRSSGATTIARKNGSSYEIISLKQNKLWFQFALRIALKDGVIACFQQSWFKRNVGDEIPFDLTDELFSDIVKVSKISGKLKSYEVVDAPKAFKILTLKESIPVTLLQRFFPELPTEQEGLHQKIGPFDVIFDHENPKEQESIQNLVAKTVESVSKAGFSEYLYGKIFVVEKLKGRTVADYHASDDTIRISHKARTKEDLRTMIHELGHRIVNKGGVDLSKIKSKFREVLEGFSLDVEPGAILTDKKDGKKYKYIGQALYSRTKTYRIKELKTIEGQTVESGDYRVSAFYFTNFDGDFKFNSEWFPSAYSKTNHEEWFCEILSFALTRGDQLYLDFVKDVRK